VDISSSEGQGPAATVFDILVKQLGHRPADASRLIENAFRRHPGIATAEALFDEIYREAGAPPTTGDDLGPAVNTVLGDPAAAEPNAISGLRAQLEHAHAFYVTFTSAIGGSPVWPVISKWALPAVAVGFLLYLLATAITEVAKNPWLPAQVLGEWGSGYPYVILAIIALIGIVLALVLWPVTVCVLLVHFLGWFPGLVVAGLLFIVLLVHRACNSIDRLTDRLEQSMRSREH
jgi:hypothetical protein